MTAASPATASARTPTNFLTHDGRSPDAIRQLARQELNQYATVRFREGHRHASAMPSRTAFPVRTQAGVSFSAHKLLLATGVARPDAAASPALRTAGGALSCIARIATAMRCAARPSASSAMAKWGFDFARLLSNWSQNLTLFTDGASTLNAEETADLTDHGITIVEGALQSFTA